MVQPVPSLHLVQAAADEISRDGYDVHTVNLVLWDGHIWQTVIEATDQDLENKVFRFNLDLHGYNLVEAEVHHG